MVPAVMTARRWVAITRGSSWHAATRSGSYARRPCRSRQTRPSSVSRRRSKRVAVGDARDPDEPVEIFNRQIRGPSLAWESPRPPQHQPLSRPSPRRSQAGVLAGSHITMRMRTSAVAVSMYFIILFQSFEWMRSVVGEKDQESLPCRACRPRRLRRTLGVGQSAKDVGRDDFVTPPPGCCA